MFVDEKKAGEKVDTRSDLERFIAWAKTRDPNESYYFANSHDCVLARWDRSEGRDRVMFNNDIAKLFDGHGLRIARPSDGLWQKVGDALAEAIRVQRGR